MKSIEQVQHENEGAWLKLPGVVGVGISEHNGMPCLKIFVTDSSIHPAGISAQIEGYPIIVEISGAIRALNGDSIR